MSRITASSRCFFFFNDTATTEIYTLSLHDALPISARHPLPGEMAAPLPAAQRRCDLRRLSQISAPRPVVLQASLAQDRESTRLNSSHSQISYAVFCLKKKNYIVPPLSAPRMAKAPL